MDKSPKWLPVFVVGLLVVAAAFALTGQGDASRAISRSSPSAADSIPDIVGTWTGTWQDTVFPDASGDLAWEITQNGSFFSASGSIDLSYFGLGSVQGTATGSITRELLVFSFEAPTVGSGSGSITDDLVSGAGAVLMPPIGSFTFEGTLTDDTINAGFNFTNPGSGAGTAILTKETPVEPASWGQVKSRFREPGD